MLQEPEKETEKSRTKAQHRISFDHILRIIKIYSTFILFHFIFDIVAFSLHLKIVSHIYSETLLLLLLL